MIPALDANSILGAFSEMKADYGAARPSKFRKTRNRLGGSGDAHYYNETEFRQLREYALAMERDDAVIGQLFDRAVDNRVRCGFTLQPETGDETLDNEIDAIWTEFWNDPLAVDPAARFSGPQMEWLVDRTTLLVGDIFVVPLDDGRLQILEGDRCTTPRNTRRKNVIHGVMLDRMNRAMQYWFAKDWDRTQHVQRVSDVDKISAFITDDLTGELVPNVFHIFDPRRFTQSRGITALHAVSDVAGMFDDLQFAQVLKAQIAAMITLFFEREVAFQGNQAAPQLSVQTQENESSTSDTIKSTTSTFERGQPIMAVRGQPGEKIQGFSPQIPNDTFFEHVRLILRMIGANIGMPLTLVLLDTTNTTFHGYRGELDQAKIGFERGQFNLEQRFHRPVYNFKLRHWLRTKTLRGSSVMKHLRAGSLFKHSWGKPGWRYVDPLNDAKADSHRIEKLLAAPSDVAAERGRHYGSMVKRIVRDNANAIREAHKAAETLRSEGIEISWRQVLMLILSDKAIPEQWAGQDVGEIDGETPADRDQRREREREEETGQPGGRFGARLNGAAGRGGPASSRARGGAS